MPDCIIMENFDLLKKLIAEYQETVNPAIHDRKIFNAIFIYYQDYKELNRVSKIYHCNLDYNELKSFLWKYDFCSNSIEFETNIPTSLEVKLFQKRVKIKNNGIGWIVHKNDKDPFPSNPHAHNTENNLKLHLGTGEIFRKTTQQAKIPRKELLAIRKKLEPRLSKIGLSLPVLAP